MNRFFAGIDFIKKRQQVSKRLACPCRRFGDHVPALLDKGDALRLNGGWLIKAGFFPDFLDKRLQAGNYRLIFSHNYLLLLQKNLIYFRAAFLEHAQFYKKLCTVLILAYDVPDVQPSCQLSCVPQ
ncbi:Uncharacterised protein [Mycobacteroides abscessus subsp. abscessus]|nr:Uncharacterised protein [Mycobacteroides abscessus subsp. abscessus]